MNLKNFNADVSVGQDWYITNIEKLQSSSIGKFIPKQLIQFCDFMFKPIEGDEYGRSALTIHVDTATGVTEHQMKQRAGMLVHEIVLQEPNSDWVDLFEAWLDVQLDRLIYKP